MLTTSIKEKFCTAPNCGRLFLPARPMQAVCSAACASRKVRADKKREREEVRKRKEAIKKRSEWLSEAQMAFNAWIRARDAGQPCISCQRHHTGQLHAGHYLSVGARPELRFEELNVHLQCAPCNTHLSGNAVLFRQGLIAKLGLQSVEWLEGPHEPKKYTIPELIEVKATYRRKLRELKNGGSE